VDGTVRGVSNEVESIWCGTLATRTYSISATGLVLHEAFLNFQTKFLSCDDVTNRQIKL